MRKNTQKTELLQKQFEKFQIPKFPFQNTLPNYFYLFIFFFLLEKRKKEKKKKIIYGDDEK